MKLLTPFLFYLVGTAALLVVPAAGVRWLTSLAAMAGAIAGLFLALPVLAKGQVIVWTGHAPFPALSFALRLDPLGAFFLILIGWIAVPVLLYRIGYKQPASPAEKDSRSAGLFLGLFLASLTLIVTADNVFTFLFAWEGMALFSYLLLLTERQNRGQVETANWYAVLSQAGFAMIAGALILGIAEAASGDFTALRESAPAWSPVKRNLLFVCLVLGFGSKAGLVPLHVWLPKAHPAASSEVSALMSGVLIKMGFYGMIRFGLDLFGGGPAWWGGALLLLGALSALTGVLYALMQNDLKRLLAFSTIENAGILFMALGLGFVFHSFQLRTLASFALVAALFHALNHGCFKSLLFLGAGAVGKSAASRDMEQLGGLIHRMPMTAFCFLIGSAAIAALPPLNGFSSEWMVFQALLAGVQVPQPFMAAVMGLAAGVLALTGGLAAACFVKAFGITFLAMPRSAAAAEADEAHPAMRAAMLLLVASCLALGLASFAVIPWLEKTFSLLPGTPALAPPAESLFHLGGPGGASRISPPVLSLCLVLVPLALWIGLRVSKANLRLRRTETWGCGRLVQTARMEYTSTAFAEPLRRIFADLYRPSRDVTVDYHPESKYFIQSISYHTTIRSWFEDSLYQPVVNFFLRIGKAGRWIQSGSVHRYLTYLFLALLMLLLLTRWL